MEFLKDKITLLKRDKDVAGVHSVLTSDTLKERANLEPPITSEYAVQENIANEDWQIITAKGKGKQGREGSTREKKSDIRAGTLPSKQANRG